MVALIHWHDAVSLQPSGMSDGSFASLQSHVVQGSVRVECSCHLSCLVLRAPMAKTYGCISCQQSPCILRLKPLRFARENQNPGFQSGGQVPWSPRQTAMGRFRRGLREAEKWPDLMVGKSMLAVTSAEDPLNCRLTCVLK